MPTLTIFEALAWAANKLKYTDTLGSLTLQNPKLDAQVILAACLNKPPLYLFVHGDETLDTEVSERFLHLIERRAKHEPVAYLLGEKEFYKRTFTVTPATLIPRPETEMLVDMALQEMSNDGLFIDVGTGSGAIAVTLAAESTTEVIAIDQSHEALVVAHTNAKRHDVAEKIAFLQGNLLKPFFEMYAAWTAQAKPKRLIIVANLPYITDNQWETLEADVKDYEPKTALVGGVDGLALYDEMFMQLAARLRDLPEFVTVLFEIDPSQASSAQSLAQHYFREASIAVHKDYAGLARIVTLHCGLKPRLGKE